MIVYVISFLFFLTSFRPAPMARTLQAWPCLRCGSQLAGGKPPGPPGMHALSQLWYSCLIPVLVHNSHLSSGVLLSSESSMLYLDLHLYHSTHFTQPCLARGKALVHMFNLCFATNVLFKSPKLHFSLHQWHGTCFARPCLPRGKPLGPQYTCSIPVLVHLFDLCFSTYVLLKLSKLHFNLHQWHGTHCTQPACQGQAPWTSESSHCSGIHRNPTGIPLE